MTGQEREWTALGDRQEVNPQRLAGIEARFEASYGYAIKSETHLWGVTLMHQASDATLDALDGGPGQPLLDADTLLMRPAVGCYVCETAYDPRARRRKCPGEPRQDPSEGPTRAVDPGRRAARPDPRAGAGMSEEAAVVRVLRCPCGKTHLAAGISEVSTCACGERLWPLLWDGTAR